MTIITPTTPDLISTVGLDLGGKTVALKASKGRFANPLLQLHVATGGFGCKPDSLGSGVFVRPLFVESPEGSGTLVRNTATGYEDGSFKARRADILGVVSDALLTGIATTAPVQIEPADIDDLCVVVLDPNSFSWGKDTTVAGALKRMGKRGVRGCYIAVIHSEASVTDMGGISTPGYAVKEGRDHVQWVANPEKALRPTLAQAKEMAAALIAASKVQA